MTVEVFEDGTVKWHIYRKQYKKARYRRKIWRDINWYRKNCSECGHLMIIL